MPTVSVPTTRPAATSVIDAVPASSFAENSRRVLRAIDRAPDQRCRAAHLVERERRSCVLADDLNAHMVFTDEDERGGSEESALGELHNTAAYTQPRACVSVAGC
jgi:hypothetical protein